MIAATNGHVDLVQLLFDYGADPNRRNYDGVTALHNAVIESHVNIAEALLDHGADTTVRDRLGNTPVDLALRSDSNKVCSLFT